MCRVSHSASPHAGLCVRAPNICAFGNLPRQSRQVGEVKWIYLLSAVCFFFFRFADLHASVKLLLYYGCTLCVLKDGWNKEAVVVTPDVPTAACCFWLILGKPAAINESRSWKVSSAHLLKGFVVFSGQFGAATSNFLFYQFNPVTSFMINLVI